MAHLDQVVKTCIYWIWFDGKNKKGDPPIMKLVWSPLVTSEILARDYGQLRQITQVGRLRLMTWLGMVIFGGNMSSLIHWPGVSGCGTTFIHPSGHSVIYG